MADKKAKPTTTKKTATKKATPKPKSTKPSRIDRFGGVGVDDI